MKIEEIFELWSKDSKLDKTELDHESLRIPELHNKYYKILVPERKLLFALKEDRKKLLLDKLEYYSGKMSDEDLARKGWTPFPHRLLKDQVETYIDADSEVIQYNLKINNQEEKVDLLESIIKSFTQRGYSLRVAMDFLKFTNGIS